mgnify:CR=1 FL=1
MKLYNFIEYGLQWGGGVEYPTKYTILERDFFSIAICDEDASFPRKRGVKCIISTILFNQKEI